MSMSNARARTVAHTAGARRGIAYHRRMTSARRPDLMPRRVDGLEVREVPDGFVVYDSRTDRLHFMNGTAAFVLESCDGATRVDELVALVGAAFRLDDDPADEVDACVQRLLSEGLVVDPAAPHSERKPV